MFESESLTIYRGTRIPEINLGDRAKMQGIFAALNPKYAKSYGAVLVTYQGHNVKVLDYDLSKRGSDAENFLTSSGKTLEEKFDKDPRYAMAMLFMIPSSEFIDTVKEA